MISKSGFVSVVQSNGLTRFFGPSSDPNLDYQNVRDNGLLLYKSRHEAMNTCQQLAQSADAEGQEIYPMEVNFRIAETTWDLKLVILQKTMIVIVLAPGSNSLVGCEFIGRKTDGSRPVTDQASSLETNGLRTFCNFNAVVETHLEYMLKTQAISLFSSFWAKMA